MTARKRSTSGQPKSKRGAKRPGSADSTAAALTLATHTVESWEDFMASIADKLDGEWLFRGVSRRTYELRPSIGRGATGPNELRERNLLERFKREARPYLGFQPQDDWEWLAIGQHHGIPTRLIDWSETPLIAAYFAVIEHLTHDGGVYVIRRPEEKREVTKESPFKIRRTIFFYPGHVTRRITAQRGLFTLHSKPWEVFAPSDLVFLEVPAKLKPEFRTRLDGFGVNHASVFPDIDGFSHHLAWTYRSRETRSAGRRATSTASSASTAKRDPEDPQKGMWGGRATAGGWTLKAKVPPRSENGWYDVELTVRSTTAGRRLSKPVVFHLHDTFPEPVREVKAKGGIARLNLWAYGAFTVGAEVLDDGTTLELDLSTVDAPARFRNA